MKKIKKTSAKNLKTVLFLLIIGVAIYFGFEPLFEMVGSGILGRILSVFFGAIIVVIITTFLLNKQTEVEQESKRNERVFEERVNFYNNCIDKMEKIFNDGKIDMDELPIIEFLALKLNMLSGDETIEKFTIFQNAILDRANEPEIDEKTEEQDRMPIEINSGDKKRFREFIGQCRIELGLSEREMSEKILKMVEEAEEKSEEIKAPTKYREDLFEFWSIFNKKIEKYPNFIKWSPSIDQWRAILKLVKGANINVVANKKFSRVEVYLDTGDKDLNKQLFDRIKEHQSIIEEQYGKKLIWDRLDNKRACRIKFENTRLLVTNQDDWDNIMNFFIDDGISMQKVFEPIFKKIKH